MRVDNEGAAPGETLARRFSVCGIGRDKGCGFVGARFGRDWINL